MNGVASVPRMRRGPAPYRAAVAHQADLVARFGSLLPAVMPFFPTRTGKPTNKDHAIAALRVLADQLAIPRPSHNQDYTGHSFRVTGAQYVAAIGVELAMIQLLARWASDVVLR